nr:immunoglobulin heavy chain junction region [Macaca mulatta]
CAKDPTYYYDSGYPYFDYW